MNFGILVNVNYLLFCSLSTNLCLRQKPEVLAIAHLNLAGKLANFDLKSSIDSPSNKPWWLVFNKGCSEAVVEGTVQMCMQNLIVYEAEVAPRFPQHRG